MSEAREHLFHMVGLQVDGKILNGTVTLDVTMIEGGGTTDASLL